jgi:hypothetical protein
MPHNKLHVLPIQSSRDNSNLFFHVEYVFGFSTTIGEKRNTSAYSIFPN